MCLGLVYCFFRKLLREDRPEIQRALQEVLYSSPSSSAKGDGSALKFNRLLTLLNNAAGSVSTKEGAAFVDIDAVPEDGKSFLLSDSVESLRNLLGKEVDGAIDVVFRRIVRKGFEGLMIALAPPRPPSIPIFGDIFPRLPSSLLYSFLVVSDSVAFEESNAHPLFQYNC